MGRELSDPALEEQEQLFRAGLAELRSFLSMADERLQRLALFTGDDDRRARQVRELHACLQQARSCIARSEADSARHP